MFAKSAKNDSDILMKNLDGELHEKHSKIMIDENSEFYPDFGIFKDKRKIGYNDALS